MAICAQVATLADEENCRIANNWLPVIAKAMVSPAMKNHDHIISISNSCLPKSMQTCSNMEMLLSSIDPKHEMNADQDTMLEIQQMVSDDNSKICVALDRIVDNSTFSARAKEVRSNISDLRAGLLGKKRPRGKAPNNTVWNSQIGMWVEMSKTEVTTPSSKRTHAEAFHPEGEAELTPPGSSTRVKRQIYDADLKDYVDITDDEEEPVAVTEI